VRPRRRLAAAAGLAVAALSLTVPGALGDAQVTAVVRDQFGTSTYTIDQGQSVSFANNDIDSHNVTATAPGADGSPLFASATIGTGQTAAVSGTRYLTSGSYSFYCTVHPSMKATLVVTSAGVPVPRPGGSSPPPPPSGPPPVVVSPRSGKHHAKRRKHHRTRHVHRRLRRGRSHRRR
jgi:plastocyanin